MARMGGQVHVAKCIGRGDRERQYGVGTGGEVQLAAFYGSNGHMEFKRCFYRYGWYRIFQLADAQAHAAANVIYEDFLWANRIFFYDADTDWTLYGSGDSKDTFYSESCRPGHKYGSGSCVGILEWGCFWKLGVVGACNCDSLTAQAIVMSIMIVGIVIQKRRKCTKKELGFWQKSGGNICRESVRSDSDSKYREWHIVQSPGADSMISGSGAEAVATQRVGGQIESRYHKIPDGFARH